MPTSAEAARLLVADHHTRDPLALLEALGVTVLFQPGLGRLKGFYKPYLRQHYVVVNDDLDARQKQVVAAHELGHYVLHRDLAKTAPLGDFQLYDETRRTEHQANVFAAELLISDEEVLRGAEEGLDFSELCRTLAYDSRFVTFKLYSMVRRGFPLNLPEMPNSRFLAD